MKPRKTAATGLFCLLLRAHPEKCEAVFGQDARQKMLKRIPCANEKSRLVRDGFLIPASDVWRRKRKLLDLRFLEVDVLARNRVVLCLCHLFRHRAAVLLRYVEEAGVSGRQKLDLDGRSLGHIEIPALS